MRKIELIPLSIKEDIYKYIFFSIVLNFQEGLAGLNYLSRIY